MDKIYLKKVIPEIFVSSDKSGSEIWQKDICLVRGEHYLIKAVSGAGKSSLCSFLYGYRRDYEGQIVFGEEDIRGFSRSHWEQIRRNSLSIVFQELRLFPELTARENVEIKNKLTGFKSRAWIDNTFDRLGLKGKAETVAGKLSFGQQQRVALIRALCQPFGFVLLDEPVSHLDDANNRLCGDLLLEEAGRQGAGIVVTSIGKHPEMKYDKEYRL